MVNAMPAQISVLQEKKELQAMVYIPCFQPTFSPQRTLEAVRRTRVLVLCLRAPSQVHSKLTGPFSDRAK